MLTCQANRLPVRKDHPWLLVILSLIWVGGTTFFHSPWQPYEPYVVAVVKSILTTNSWLVPYIAKGYPYLDLQPFYFWPYALLIKFFGSKDIANSIRLINSFIILVLIILFGKIGSNLLAYKNGRSVVMLLISTIGFINNAYQLSPHIIVLLGFILYFYSLQNSAKAPGVSSGILAIGLILISIDFTAGFILIGLLMLILLPLLDKRWSQGNYWITCGGGICGFILIFGSYVCQLNTIDHSFFLIWKNKYFNLINLSLSHIYSNLIIYIKTLLWYLIPSWLLVGWTIYRRRAKIFEDKILAASGLFAILLILFALFSKTHGESIIFPIIIPMVLLASVELDSIRISIVSLFNWFSIFIFGSVGVGIFILYSALNSNWPKALLDQAKYYAPNYIYAFNIWQLFLALVITVIWLLMITRKHIRGREMVTNWACGTTFGLIIFISLALPWFDSLLSFKNMVNSSYKFLNSAAKSCIAVDKKDQLLTALWYYYADIRLKPEANLYQTNCSEILTVSPKSQLISVPNYQKAWSYHRAIDGVKYTLLVKAKP